MLKWRSTCRATTARVGVCTVRVNLCVCPSVLSGGLRDVIPDLVANCLYRLAQGLLSLVSCAAAKW